MKATGERFIPHAGMGEKIEMEHMHRYHAVAKSLNGKKVLDAACGVGYGSCILAEYADQVIGIDISKEAISYAKEQADREKVIFREMSIEKLDFPDHSFDAVISFETIEHVSETLQHAFLAEVRRVLKRDGVFIISTPDLDVAMRISDGTYKNPFHVKEYGCKEFVSLLKGYFPSVETHMQKIMPCSCITGEGGMQFHDADNFDDGEYIIAVCAEYPRDLHIGGVYASGISQNEIVAFAYFDYGQGFSEEHKSVFPYYLGSDGHFELRIDLPQTEIPLKAIRFDPCKVPCRIWNISAKTDTENMGIVPLNASFMKNNSAEFMHYDPNYAISLDDNLNAKCICVQGYLEIISPSLAPAYWMQKVEKQAIDYNDRICKREQELSLLQGNYISLENEHVKLRDGYSRLETDINWLKSEQIQLQGEHIQLQNRYISLQNTNMELSSDYARLEKDNMSLKNEQTQLQEQHAQLQSAYGQLQVANDHMQEQYAQLQAADDQLQEQYVQLQGEQAQLQGAYGQLQEGNNQLQVTFNHVQNEYAQLQYHCEQLNLANEQMSAENERLALQYQIVTQSQCWKMTTPLRAVLDAVKRTRIGDLLHRAMQHWRYFGFTATVKKTISFIKNRNRVSPENPVNEEMENLFEPVEEVVVDLSTENITISEALTYYQDNPAKKVLIISHELNLTGAPVAILYMAICLKKLGYLPVVVSPNDGALREEFTKQGIPAVLMPNIFISEEICEFAPYFDMIFANTIVSAPAVMSLYKYQTPIFWWIHEAEVSYREEILSVLPDTLPQNVSVYAGGAYARQKLQEHCPNWNVKELLYYVPVPAVINQPIDLPTCAKGKKLFACIGVLEYRKGQDILVEAIRQLPRNILKQSYFIFVGKECYASHYQDICDLMQQHPHNVHYIQELSLWETQALYRQMDCLICPSRDDPMPIVVTEALALGKMVICSENTGSASILMSENAGLVYQSDSPQELAAMIRAVLTKPRKYNVMCKNARKAYEKYFSISAFDEAVKEKCLSLLPDIRNINKTVSVVIPSYNAGMAMTELLERLYAQKGVCRIEIIVVDSGSTDGTPKLCRSYGAKVIEISQEEFSHSYARNLGAENAEGDILLFMTQDALPQNENWMKELITPIVTGEAIATSCFDHCPESTDIFYKILLWNHVSYLGILNGDKLNEIDFNETADDLRKKGSLNDVSVAVDAKTFSAFQYRFDYAEDLDLGIRLLKAGYRIKLLRSTKSIHGHTRTAEYYLKRSFVEKKTLGKIQKEWMPIPQPKEIVARKILFILGVIIRLLQEYKVSVSCKTGEFITKVQKELTELKYSPIPLEFTDLHPGFSET